MISIAMVASAGAFSACSILTSFDSLVGPSTDASVTDTTNDASVRDASTASDSADAATFSCADVDADLCDDFSRDAALGPGNPWTTSSCANGSMVIENGVLHIAYPATTGKNYERCDLIRCFSTDCQTNGPVYGGFTIDLDFRYETSATSGIMSIAQPLFYPTTPGVSDAGGNGYTTSVASTDIILAFDVGANAAYSQTQVDVPDASVNAFPATNGGETPNHVFTSGAQSHIHLDVSITNATTTLTITIGGTVYTAAAPFPPLINGAQPGVLQLPLGYIQDFYQMLPAFDFYIDNVVVRLTP